MARDIDYISNTAVYVDGDMKMAFKTPLFDHQVECLRRFALEFNFALLAEMGTGKTCIMINDFAILNTLGKVKNMLVIAPNGVQWNWVLNEIPKHMPDEEWRVIKYAGYGGQMLKKDTLALEELLDPKQKCSGRILCVNWDSLSNAKGVAVIKKFLGDNPWQNMIVLDESDYAKNPETKRAKTLMSIAPLANYRRIMTGTLITNSPFDAYTQFNFLDPRILNCRSFIAFKQRHAVFLPQTSGLVKSLMQRTGRAPLIIATDANGRPRYKNLELLSRQIEPYSYIAKKSDCVDLPCKIYQNLYVELTPVQKKAYDLILNDALLQLGDDIVNIPNRLSALSHLCMCTGNHYSPSLIHQYADSDSLEKSLRLVDPSHNPKLKALTDIVTLAVSNNDQVLVWARYVQEIEDILASLKGIGVSAVAYYGQVSTEDRNAAVDKFQSGEAKVFVANPQSGGTGLTLTAGNVVVYYSNSFSLHDRLQSEDRCHRIGQKKTVIYINLLARNTVDERIQQVLDSKQDVAQAIVKFSSFIKGGQ